MKNTLKYKMFNIISFVGSIASIIGLISDFLKIRIPEIIFPEIIISFDYLYANGGVYTLILFLLIFFISLFAGHKTKIYNAKIAEKYKEIIDYFQYILLTKNEFSYEHLSCLIKEIYPYKNKSKINLVFKRKIDDVVLYDTSNYNEWINTEMKKVYLLNERLHKRRYDWRATSKYFEKRAIHVFIKDEQNNGISFKIYSGSKAVVTKRKKKMMMPFLNSIGIFMYTIWVQQNG